MVLLLNVYVFLTQFTFNKNRNTPFEKPFAVAEYTLCLIKKTAVNVC